ncbi:MAG: hypothetical protein ACK55Z_09865, partial [bacterium]
QDLSQESGALAPREPSVLLGTPRGHGALPLLGRPLRPRDHVPDLPGPAPLQESRDLRLHLQ